MEELESNGVQIYKFPVDDETVAEMNSSMNVSKLRMSELRNKTCSQCLLSLVKTKANVWKN